MKHQHLCQRGMVVCLNDNDADFHGHFLTKRNCETQDVSLAICNPFYLNTNYLIVDEADNFFLK